MAGPSRAISTGGSAIRPYERPLRTPSRARGNPLRKASYQAPGHARFFLHIAVVAMIAAAVFGTSMLSTAGPGSASIDEQAVLSAQDSGLASVTARFTQTSTERLGLETQLEPQPSSDNLLLAVLSLEASTTSSDVEASMERIQSLGTPQESPPLALLQETEEEDSGDEPEPLEEPATEEEEEPQVEDTACADSGNSAYCVYTVAAGDTLSGIAALLGFTGNGSLSAAEMLAESNKPDVASSDHIEPGQNIRIPYETGIVHTVLFAETASEIAADYGVTTEAILGSPYNAIGADGIVVIGQQVFVPDPAQLPVNEEVELTLEEPEPTETPTEEPTEEPTTEPVETEPTEEPTEEPTVEPSPATPESVPMLGELTTPTPEPTDTPEPTATPEPTDTPEATPTPEADESEEAEPTPEPTRTPSSGGGSSRFIWPTQGPISSYFGPSHPLGIDIDLFNNPNADIVASRAGEVVFAGGDPCCSYGYYVIVDHGNGVQTLYAHLSRILVSTGQSVAQGELLGYGGTTGNSTGHHLHFEIRVDDNVVDPLRYLP